MSINTYFLRHPDKKKGSNSEEATPQDSASEDGALAPALAPAQREMISEITANISKIIDDKLSPLSHLLQAHREELDSHGERITEVEGRVSALEDIVNPVEDTVKVMEQQVMDLRERIDDLENRGRRKNIRIVGLPEGAEGDNPLRFFESWLPKALNIETKAGRFKLERAHRALVNEMSATPSNKPRSVVVRFHNYQDKQRVMNASWNMGMKKEALKYDGATVMIFQDLSAAVLRKRKTFDGVKKRLKAMGATYNQVYPALLKVTYRGSTKTFKDPATVEKYIDSIDPPNGDNS